MGVPSDDPQLYLHRFSDWLSSLRRPATRATACAMGSVLLSMLRALSDLRGDVKYEWGFTCAQRLSAATVAEIASRASRAACVLGITRCCESMFASGAAEGKKVICTQLSRSLSGRLQRKFHEAHLRAVSGAQVDLKAVGDTQSDLLQLRAEGTAAQIRMLRLELQRYIDASHMVGMPVTRASQYFMEGASLLLFEGCLSLRAQLCFRPSDGGCCVPAHALKERTTPQLNTPHTGDEWEMVAKNRFMDHWSTQLAKVCRSGSLTSPEARVRFGTFYITDVSKKLPRTSQTLSVAQLQEAMVRHSRYRNMCSAEPPALHAQLHTLTVKKSDKMTVITPSKGRGISKPAKAKRKGDVA